MLKIKGLTHNYSTGLKITFPDLELNKAESCCVIGASGKGKSTLLHLISGLLPVKEGDVFIDNQNIKDLSSKEKNKIRSEKLSVMLQNVQFVGNLNLTENISLSILNKTVRNDSYIFELLQNLDIHHLASKNPKNFSGGERQRAALALALAKKPSLLLADEPTANLDDINAKKVADLLHSLPQKYNTALLIVSHDSRLKSTFSNVYSL